MKKRIAMVMLTLLAFGSLILSIESQAEPVESTEPMETETQQYIVRYGTTYDYGSTIVTEDKNEWTLIDAPEYENGTEVRVLFDSNKTEIVEDDVIIDITEKEKK